MALTKLKCAALIAGAAMFAIGSAPAGAAGVRQNDTAITHTATSDATDFSAQRRRGGGRGYGRRGIGGGAVAGALAAGVIGSAIIASQPRGYYRERYYDGGPRYYGGPGYGRGYGYYGDGW